MHAENQPGLSASCAAGTKRGARNPVPYKELEETEVNVLAQARNRGIKTQKRTVEKKERR